MWTAASPTLPGSSIGAYTINSVEQEDLGQMRFYDGVYGPEYVSSLMRCWTYYMAARYSVCRLCKGHYVLPYVGCSLLKY